jgi:hypothetical protein
MLKQSQEIDTLSSKEILEGKFEMRVRPKTAAIKCKVETGKEK